MRLFIALPLPSTIEKFLGQTIENLKRHSGNVKWVNSGNIHLTVKFLGETDPVLVGDIKNAIDRVTPSYDLMSFEIKKLGAFPNLKRPRVFWAGISGQIENLQKLARHVDLEMHELGFEKEKRGFKPHLTIGRVKRDSDLKNLCQAVEDYKLQPAILELDSLVLFKSTLTPDGPIYERLHTAVLGS